MRQESASADKRPSRLAYVHKTCGRLTHVQPSTAEIFAAHPDFYKTTFCYACASYFPATDFVWEGTNEPVGTRRTT